MKTLIERLEEIRHSRDYSSKREYINVLIPIDLLNEAITALREKNVIIADKARDIHKLQARIEELEADRYAWKIATHNACEDLIQAQARIERLEAALGNADYLLRIAETHSTSAWDKTQMNKVIVGLQKARAGQ
jgi:transcriptional regulator of aromatic amino acid metabolism